MTANKTTPNETNPIQWLLSLDDQSKIEDCIKILNIMKSESGAPPVMWGPAIIGFGHYHYKYESGRKGDWFEVGFSPRKQNISLYLMSGFDRFPDLMTRIGKFKTGKSCLYIKKLEDVDEEVLRELVKKIS